MAASECGWNNARQACADDAADIPAEKMAEVEKFAGEYEPVEALMDEFNKIAESCSNGKAVLDDKDFGKQLTDEIGLPDL